jgi:hypothetical protein
MEGFELSIQGTLGFAAPPVMAFDLDASEPFLAEFSDSTKTSFVRVSASN